MRGTRPRREGVEASSRKGATTSSETQSCRRWAVVLPTFFCGPRWPATHEQSRVRPLTRPPRRPVLIAGPGLRRTTAIGPRRRSTCRLFFLRSKMLLADRSRERATSAAHQSACSVFLHGPCPASPTSPHALSSTAFLFSFPPTLSLSCSLLFK